MPVQDRFYQLLDRIGVPTDALLPGATFESLDFDSLALIELGVAIQKEFGVIVEESELTPERTLGDIVALLGTQSAAA
ncbi:acyl carrier protein [Streptomyces sp. NPDC050560]|uniref:acyl carrier protein n=1 Tax=Streptomyces sp. NPDC050560 TaxID=3365630 RepID=UPI0037A8EF5E